LKQISLIQHHSIFLLMLIIIMSRFLVLRLHCRHLMLNLGRLSKSLMCFHFKKCEICFIKLTDLSIWTKFEVWLRLLYKEFFLLGCVLNFRKWIFKKILWFIYLLDYFLGFTKMFITIGKLTWQCSANCHKPPIGYLVEDVIKTFKELAY